MKDLNLLIWNYSNLSDDHEFKLCNLLNSTQIILMKSSNNTYEGYS